MITGDTGAGHAPLEHLSWAAAEQSQLPTAWIKGPGHLVEVANPALLTLLAVEAQDALCRPLHELSPLHLGDPSRLRAGLDECAASGTARTLDTGAAVLLVTPLGRPGAGRLSVQVLPGGSPHASDEHLAQELAEANAELLVASLREQQLAEMAARRAADLEALLQNMPEAVWVFDRKADVLLVNPAARGLFAISSPHPTVDDHERSGLRRGHGPLSFRADVLTPLLKGERFTDDEVTLLLPDGRRRQLLLSGSSVRDGLGVALVFVVYRDVTAMRDLEEARAQYVSLISHDLGGPLTAARIAAQMLERGGTDEARTQTLAGRVVKHLDRMDQMVRDLLDVRQLAVGKTLMLKLERFDLGALIRDLCADLATTHGDRFSLHCDEDVVGRWSPAELRRAVWNLGANAVKYGAAGTPIVIEVRRSGERVRISVHNEGTAISPRDQERLFAPYSRTRAAEVGTVRGWGLGLTLVRGCAEAHGGTVSVSSAEGEGTTFTMELPLEPPEAARPT